MSAVDAIVIGSGPAGITAALYLARSGCSVMLYEQMAAGGQVPGHGCGGPGAGADQAVFRV